MFLKYIILYIIEYYKNICIKNQMNRKNPKNTIHTQHPIAHRRNPSPAFTTNVALYSVAKGF